VLSLSLSQKMLSFCFALSAHLGLSRAHNPAFSQARVFHATKTELLHRICIMRVQLWTSISVSICSTFSILSPPRCSTVLCSCCLSAMRRHILPHITYSHSYTIIINYQLPCLPYGAEAGEKQWGHHSYSSDGTGRTSRINS